ncbi:hypothetical protein POF50_011395 [Streptomyces sp. SL13]|uniref:Chromosome segregation ATPase n=1 Tax=Streptantibioticus silvisoli TaxID=2705255 RepID=A0AA90H390_9ACTN|nr:hypothetical protein [Streptantibioticus silvisoli]MDI5969934.1 hypothetical protein [Streptantibioticus silvisoli]
MYELSRVLLRAVGPEAARYEDVLLDFGDAGGTFATRPTTLFGETSTIQRPSPASVLQLQNGGGKSVLIKLIFSVVLPGLRKAVGTTSTHALANFVLAGDVSHIVLEWVHARSGRRLITGKVSAWRNGRPSADTSQLLQRWYHFRPTETNGLRGLPIVGHGRYRPLTDFCDLMQQASEADPAMEYAVFRRHGLWTDRLTDLGLDPVLFEYQRAMNADEGDAADAFAFGNDSAFINFLLRVVVPPQPPEELAALLNTYADKLSVRSDLEREKEFVEGCLVSLEPLARAREEWLKAKTQREEAAERLDDVLRRIRIRAARELEIAALRKSDRDQLRDEFRRENDRHCNLTGLVTELRRITAGMRLEEAEADEKDQRKTTEEAELADSAWQVTPAVLSCQDAATEDRRLAEIIAATHAAARPALVARDAATRHLADALTALRDQARSDAAAKEESAAELDRQAEEAQTEHDAAVATAATRAAEAAQLHREIDAIAEEVRSAVYDGRLLDGLSAGEAADEARRTLVETKARTVELETALGQVEEDLDRAGEKRLQLQMETTRADEALRSAQDELGKAIERADALAAEPGFFGLLGPDTVNLEQDVDALLERLAEVAQETDNSRAEIRLLMAGDERARTALETTELLPPSVEAIQACKTLKASGVHAWTGWEYLSAINDVERRRALARRSPGLATGIVVNQAEHFDAARRVLSDSELWPQTYVGVGTSGHLTNPPLDAGDGPFAVPVHPALYDERAAEAERSRLKHRHDLHKHQLAEATGRLDSAHRLATRLAQWREDCPAGHLERLRTQVQERQEGVEVARGRLEGVTETCARLGDERTTIRLALPPQRVLQEQHVEASRFLERLSAREALVPSLLEKERTAEQEAVADRERAAKAAARGRTHRDAAAALRRSADSLKNIAERLAQEITDLPPLDPMVAVDAPGPALPLPVLRRAYNDAVDEYRRVTVGEDLKAKAALARDRLHAAEKDVEDIAADVRKLAEQLLTGPDGSDGASRALAREAARRAVVVCRTRLVELSVITLARRSDMDVFDKPAEPVDLAPYQRPAHLGEALRLVTEAERDRQASDRVRQELRHHLDRAERDYENVRRNSEAFQDLTRVLGPGPGPDAGTGENGFEGDPGAARQRHAAVHSAHEQAREDAEKARRKERTEADKLASHAADQRFAHLDLPSKSIIIATPRSDLPDTAGQWEKALRQRLSSLDIDLNSIDRHRRSIVRQLAQQVEEALTTLRRAERLSRLPDGLGDWSGETFLQILFKAPKGDALADRLATVVDETSAEVVAGRVLQRDGISLLLRGVAAAAGSKGFRVRILKPEAVLRKTRVPVSQLKDVFSGGQVLTTAIVLYCTMAALRANERGRSTHRHSGVLFLDNPIGRASATYLLRLQQAVAGALGVQLIFTTGLEDLTVLENFPLVVRMRNEADLRAHRQYLRVHERMSGLLDASLSARGEDEGEPLAVSAVRYYRRPVQAGDPGND